MKKKFVLFGSLLLLLVGLVSCDYLMTAEIQYAEWADNTYKVIDVYFDLVPQYPMLTVSVTDASGSLDTSYVTSQAFNAFKNSRKHSITLNKAVKEGYTVTIYPAYDSKGVFGSCTLSR